MKTLNKKLLDENVEKIARHDILENNVFGSSYIVRQNGKIVCEKYFGVTDIDNGENVNQNTIFRLASMTKPVTAVAIMILVDRGLLSLSDSVKKYLPKFENIHIVTEHGLDLGESKTDVTVMHLLTHTSGFGSLKSGNMSSKDKKTVENTISYFVKAGLDFEPFTRQAYSPFAAFDVLAELVERISTEDYEAFLQKEIFSPCNMKDTTFIPSESQYRRLISMHDKKYGKNCSGETTKNCIFEDFPCDHKLAGAGLVSTLADYSNFAEMLLNKGKSGNKQIVSEKTSELISIPHVPFDIMPQNERWGLGVRVITGENISGLPMGAYGWSGAYGTHFWVDPENQITAVFMKNSKFDGGSGNRSACRFERTVYDCLTD